MKNKIIKSTYYPKDKLPATIEVVRGIDKDFINIQLVANGKNEVPFGDSVQTFKISDINRIIKALQAMVKHQKGRK